MPVGYGRHVVAAQSLRKPYDGLVCATVQNLKPAVTRIFFIDVVTKTYGDFGR